MKKTINEFTPEELAASFGKLTGEELADIKSAAVDDVFDPAFERKVKNTLEHLASDQAEEPEFSPSLPDSVRVEMDKTRETAFAQLAKEEKELDSRVEESVFGERGAGDREQEGWMKRFFQPARILRMMGAAAAIVVGGVLLFQGPREGAEPVIASQAKLLTPGPVTGFTEPVFVWKTDRKEAVKLEVIDVNSGSTVASGSNVVSPVVFSDLDIVSHLVPDGRYLIRISEGTTLLTEREFATMPHAVQRGPRREINLAGVIRQCEQFIASDRPADAWMLWSQLTDLEKSDSRMQELKKQILAKIG